MRIECMPDCALTIGKRAQTRRVRLSCCEMCCNSQECMNTPIDGTTVRILNSYVETIRSRSGCSVAHRCGLLVDKMELNNSSSTEQLSSLHLLPPCSTRPSSERATTRLTELSTARSLRHTLSNCRCPSLGRRIPQATTAKMGFAHAKPGPTPARWSQSSGTLWTREVGRIFQVPAIPRSGGTNVDLPMPFLVGLESLDGQGSSCTPTAKETYQASPAACARVRGRVRGMHCMRVPKKTQSHRCSNPPLALASNGLPSRRGL